jgi:hypothetical protein
MRRLRCSAATLAMFDGVAIAVPGRKGDDDVIVDRLVLTHDSRFSLC